MKPNTGIALLFCACAQAALAQAVPEAARDYEKARALEGQKRYEEAEALYRSAETRDAAYWRYSYMLGELLLGKSGKYGEALAAFERAWARGYAKGITRHKIGACFWHMDRFDEAMASFEESLRLNREAAAGASGKDLDHVRYQLADTWVWICKIHEGRRDNERLFDASVEGLKYRDIQGWLQGYAMRSALNLGHLHFGEGAYDKAIGWYTVSLEYTKNSHPEGEREWNDYPDWRLPTDTLIKLVRHRKSLGQIKPSVTHRVLGLFIMHQDVSFTDETGKDRHVVAATTPTMMREAELRFRWMRQVIEAMSDGRMTLDYALESDETEYVYSGVTRPAWIGDREILYRRLPETDTVFRLWPYGEGLGTGGAGWVALVPGSLPGPLRGGVSVHPEHSHGMWLHEFFHVVERMADISPTHGYYDENRAAFPGWRGRKNNQLDFFWWHFRTTIPPLGWESMNFRLKSPGTYPPRAEFKAALEKYLKIPMKERQ